MFSTLLSPQLEPLKREALHIFPGSSAQPDPPGLLLSPSFAGEEAHSDGKSQKSKEKEQPPEVYMYIVIIGVFTQRSSKSNYCQFHISE